MTEVDVIVPLRDEAHRIPEFLAMLAAQTLQPRRVVIADGMSTDGSRELLAAVDDPRVVVVDNPERIVPAALNAALAHVTAPLVARMDTHASYDEGYLAAVVALLDASPDVVGVGGAMATAGRGPWGQAIAATLSRGFGLGGARHRVGGEAGPIPHVFSGCYRTSALRAVGGWDERFSANEDFEADIRLGEAGGTMWLAPDARSTWYVRDTPQGLAKQMWRYGWFKALTLRLHPGSLQPRQLAPPALVLLLAALGLARRPRALAATASAYAVAAGTLGARAALADGASPVKGALVPPVVHLSWGAGLIAGSLRYVRERPTAAAPGEERVV